MEASKKIRVYTEGMSQRSFAGDPKTIDAVVRNLEIIGEAVTDQVRSTHSSADWKKIAGLRDILIHEYFGVDMEIIWDVIRNKLPVLEQQVQHLLKTSQ